MSRPRSLGMKSHNMCRTCQDCFWLRSQKQDRSLPRMQSLLCPSPYMECKCCMQSQHPKSHTYRCFLAALKADRHAEHDGALRQPGPGHLGKHARWQQSETKVMTMVTCLACHAWARIAAGSSLQGMQLRIHMCILKAPVYLIPQARQDHRHLLSA